MKKEYYCRYCGTKATKYADICGGCYPKLKLVRKLKRICNAIKQRERG